MEVHRLTGNIIPQIYYLINKFPTGTGGSPLGYLTEEGEITDHEQSSVKSTMGNPHKENHHNRNVYTSGTLFC